MVPLAEALSRRARYPWLSNSDATARRELWCALERIAIGLDLLHERQVLHRDVGVGALFFADEEGSESLRLGGFEWSVRLGRPLGDDPPEGWSTPPERMTQASAVWRPDDDWFGFGMLCARLLLDVERFSGNPLIVRHNRVLDAVSRCPALRSAQPAVLSSYWKTAHLAYCTIQKPSRRIGNLADGLLSGAWGTSQQRRGSRLHANAGRTYRWYRSPDV